MGGILVKDEHKSGLSNPTDPPTDSTHLPEKRLERIRTRLQRVYERQGYILERADTMVENIQGKIDRLEENGRDVTTLQAALDAFEEALREAHPVYESATRIISTHEGFYADGNVTDCEQALETVRELGDRLKEIRPSDPCLKKVSKFCLFDLCPQLA